MGRFKLMAVLCGLALGFAPVALAQDAGVAGQLDRVASSSPQEKVAYVNGALSEMADAVKSVSKLVDAARRDADVDRLQCLNNRLVSLKSLQQVSEGALTAMEDDLAAGDTEQANHEMRRVAVALTKTRQLQAEAEGCGFDGTVQSGETAVTVSGGEFDGDDTTESETDIEIGLDGPEASPFM